MFDIFSPYTFLNSVLIEWLIERRFGIKMAVRSVGNYLKRWGFTPQKPLRRAYERQDKAVKIWLEETYPKIAACAKQEKAEIHWGDEAGFRSDHQTGTSYCILIQGTIKTEERHSVKFENRINRRKSCRKGRNITTSRPRTV